MALIRRQELGGFVDGLFGQNDSIDLLERARRGLEIVGELRALFAGAFDVFNDETKPATDTDMDTTLRHMRELTKYAEHEIHAVLLSCCGGAGDDEMAISHNPPRRTSNWGGGSGVIAMSQRACGAFGAFGQISTTFREELSSKAVSCGMYSPISNH